MLSDIRHKYDMNICTDSEIENNSKSLVHLIPFGENVHILSI